MCRIMSENTFEDLLGPNLRSLQTLQVYQPSSVLTWAPGEVCGSISIQVRQVFEGCCASVPWNHEGVG